MDIVSCDNDPPRLFVDCRRRPSDHLQRKQKFSRLIFFHRPVEVIYVEQLFESFPPVSADITSATAKTTDALTKLDLPAGVDIEIKL